MIVNHTVEDVLLEGCHAWTWQLKCPQMTRLSLSNSKLGCLTLENCSNLRSLDMRCKSKSFAPAHQHCNDLVSTALCGFCMCALKHTST